MILWLVLLAAVLWGAMYRFRRRNLYRLAAAIPSPREELPGIGIAHTLTGNTEDIMRSLQNYSYAAMAHGGMVKGWLGHILYFIVVDPVDLEMVLKTCMDKDDLHRFLRKVLGNGGIFAPGTVLEGPSLRALDPTREAFTDRALTRRRLTQRGNSYTSSVPIWKRRRKVLVPAFSPKIVENFVEVFSEQSEKLAEALAECAGRNQFSLWPFVSTYTLDSVFETTMGVKINAQDNPDSEFLQAMNRVLNLVCERIFHLWLQPDWLFWLFRSKHEEHQRCLERLHAYTDNIIESKRKEIKAENQSRTEVDNEFDLGSYKRQTFLDLLISSSGGERGYTNLELREEVLTLTIAGTDTSAVCIGFTLKLLGNYPEVQDRVYEELHEVFGESARPVVKEDLTRLKYLERVVKESLRLFPPVPFIIRKVLKDTKLPSGRVLPAGSGVAVSIWGAQRDPRYWGPDAEGFDPDRFLPGRFPLAHACSYMPFSNGPRNCLGYQYALMSIKTALANVLRRYRVVGDAGGGSGRTPTIRVKLDIMMKAVDGYQLALERRETR